MKMDEINLKYPLLNEKKLRFELGKVANPPNQQQKMKKITDQRKVQRDQFIKSYEKLGTEKRQKQTEEIKELYTKLKEEQKEEKQLHDDEGKVEEDSRHLHLRKGKANRSGSFYNDSESSDSHHVLERLISNHDQLIEEGGLEKLPQAYLQYSYNFSTQQDHSHPQNQHSHKHEHDLKIHLEKKIQDFREMEKRIRELRKQKSVIDAELEHLNSEYMHSKNSAVKAHEELLKLNPKSPIPKIDTDIKDHFHDFFGGWLIGRRPGFSSSNFQEFHNYSDIHDFQDFQGLGRRIW
jgi:DNA repair exonuclease SbcCD ATPase subunit